MPRDTDGLKRAARARSDGTRQRAMAVVREMQAEEQVLTFRSVAARAQVSRAWLYGAKPVREQILKLRQREIRATGESPSRRAQISHERIVATLRLRIRSLEESNRELKQQLEIAYGRLAMAPSTSHLRAAPHQCKEKA